MTEFYHSLKEVEETFFPYLVEDKEKKRLEEMFYKDPKKLGRHIAKEIIKEAKEKLNA